MSSIAVIEVCANGTITRACARALNRAHGTSFSGTTEVAHITRAFTLAGVAFREVPAASVSGADKARHTREVTRSRKAQAARAERQWARVDADWDAHLDVDVACV